MTLQSFNSWSIAVTLESPGVYIGKEEECWL